MVDINMITKEQELESLKDLGRRLLEKRPKPLRSVADDLKRMYFGERIHSLGSIDGLTILTDTGGYWLAFFSCIDDEERFWYSMYVLQCATKGYNNSIPGVEALENHIIEHAKDFGMEHEVAKIMLSIGGKIDDRGTWRPK